MDHISRPAASSTPLFELMDVWLQPHVFTTSPSNHEQGIPRFPSSPCIQGYLSPVSSLIQPRQPDLTIGNISNVFATPELNVKQGISMFPSSPGVQSFSSPLEEHARQRARERDREQYSQMSIDSEEAYLKRKRESKPRRMSGSDGSVYNQSNRSTIVKPVTDVHGVPPLQSLYSSPSAPSNLNVKTQFCHTPVFQSANYVQSSLTSLQTGFCIPGIVNQLSNEMQLIQ